MCHLKYSTQNALPQLQFEKKTCASSCRDKAFDSSCDFVHKLVDELLGRSQRQFLHMLIVGRMSLERFRQTRGTEFAARFGTQRQMGGWTHCHRRATIVKIRCWAVFVRESRFFEERSGGNPPDLCILSTVYADSWRLWVVRLDRKARSEPRYSLTRSRWRPRRTEASVLDQQCG